MLSVSLGFDYKRVSLCLYLSTLFIGYKKSKLSKSTMYLSHPYTTCNGIYLQR